MHHSELNTTIGPIRNDLAHAPIATHYASILLKARCYTRREWGVMATQPCMSMDEKIIEWVGAAKAELMDFPDDARRRAGFELRLIQQGNVPSDFKPMSDVGKGVEEIRIRTDNAYRIFYVARFKEAIYVLHAFQKKSQKTSRSDIELGQKRYNQMLQQRQELNQ
jgi:phage-related protein